MKCGTPYATSPFCHMLTDVHTEKLVLLYDTLLKNTDLEVLLFAYQNRSALISFCCLVSSSSALCLEYVRVWLQLLLA